MKKTSLCKSCDKQFTFDDSKSTGKYCTSQCHSNHRRRVYISEWLSYNNTGGKGYQLSSHVRNHLLEEANYKCSQCGWGEINPHTGRVPLEVDHIDDNPFNHSPDNLQVLCPNCHSLKTLPPQQSRGGRYSRGKRHPKQPG